MAEYTFKQFQEEFPDDASCLKRIMEIQYGGETTHCPICDKRTRFHPMTQRRAYACQECGHHIYPCAGTIFHKSRTKLTLWFFAMYLMTSTRHGVAAKEIERQTGVTYKCAWRICHELRKLMATADASIAGPMTGHVEVDEVILGGRRPRARKWENKTVAMGLVERGEKGRIVVGPVPDQTNDTLEGIVIENVAKGATISTDDLTSYRDLGRRGYDHGVVKHSKKEYVRGEHHVNTLEGHWSLFQRAVKGTHVHISAKHAWKYLAEFSYRRNMRSSHWAMFALLVQAFSLPRVRET
jgi:transposase